MSKIYAIKDQAIEAFSQPFFVQAQGQAVRMFMDESKNEQSQINRRPIIVTGKQIGRAHV